MKFALIDLDRDRGPEFIQLKGVEESEKNNILLFALPTGEAKAGSFKLITLKQNFYISYTSLNKDDTGIAAVIGVNINDQTLGFNPFNLFSTLKEMIETEQLPEIELESLDKSQFNQPYGFDIEGGEYIMASMLLLERLIVVGDHDEIIKFLGTIYEATPVPSIPYLSCVTLVKSITNNINIQGIELSEETYQDLDDARIDSTIVMLEEKQAFGSISSPFTTEIAQLYSDGKFEESRTRITDFISLTLQAPIVSAADFASEHDLEKADAKLMKTLQQRIKEMQENRQNDIYYQGVD